MTIIFSRVLVTIVLCTSPLFVYSQYEIPEGWYNHGGPEMISYNFGIDRNNSVEGNRSAYIESVAKVIDDFATLLQGCDASPFKGKKIKMVGYAKSENIDGWGGFWLRIDGEDEEEELGFDNMADRPITGTNEWTRYEIIMDVPENSVYLVYGALLYGNGKIWFDNITFEEVPEDNNKTIQITQGPINTNFEN